MRQQFIKESKEKLNTVFLYELINFLNSESQEEREEEDLCSSNHYILDRIAEKESTDNLFRSGSSKGEDDEDDQIDIKQVRRTKKGLEFNLIIIILQLCSLLFSAV